MEQCVEKINVHSQFYRLIYAQLTGAKTNPVPGAQAASAANAIYAQLAPTFEYKPSKGD